MNRLLTVLKILSKYKSDCEIDVAPYDDGFIHIKGLKPADIFDNTDLDILKDNGCVYEEQEGWECFIWECED